MAQSARIETPAPNISDLDFHNLQERQKQFDVLARLMPVVAGAQFQAGILAVGTYKGGTVKDARVDGIGWPVVAGPATISGNAIVRGIVFVDVVNVQASATVEFHGCVFSKPVAVGGGGKVACSGCRFDGSSNVNNTGPAGNAVIAACVHTSGVAHVNVTAAANNEVT